MPYQKIGTIIRKANPEKKSVIHLSSEQIKLLGDISKVALAIIAAAGIITLAVAAPNIFVAVDKIYKLKGRHLSKREKEIKTARAFYYLKKSGFIQMRPEKEGLRLFLSKLGRKKLAEMDFQTLRVPKAKKWDKKWWQIAADIPTKQYRSSADLLRRKLKELKFYPLQRTLWLYPFDPRDQIQFITEHFGISRFVTVMEINRLDTEDEKVLKNHFQTEDVL